MLKKIIAIVLGAVLIIVALAGIGTLANQGKTNIPTQSSSTGASSSSTPKVEKPKPNPRLQKAIDEASKILRTKLAALQSGLQPRLKAAQGKTQIDAIQKEFSDAMQKVIADYKLALSEARKKYGA
jgi:hypothetical protein